MYNLSIQGDSIKKRSQVINSIISAKPEIIIYGISENDFSNNKNTKSGRRNVNDINIIS